MHARAAPSSAAPDVSLFFQDLMKQNIQEEFEQVELLGGGRGVSSLLAQGQAFEEQREWAKAVQAYLKVRRCRLFFAPGHTHSVHFDSIQFIQQNIAGLFGTRTPKGRR